MPMIHLPVQSGSNKILKNMNRKHSVEDYLKIVKRLKKINPLIEFSSDFIIGYPGETNEDFNDTLKLLEEVKFINSYSFIFSPRFGTPAAKMKLVESTIAKERLLTFQKKAAEIKLSYRKTLLNNYSSVLFENKIKTNDKYFGKDKFSNPVLIDTNEDLNGKIKKVKITNVNHNTLFGEINEKEKKTEFAA